MLSYGNACFSFFYRFTILLIASKKAIKLQMQMEEQILFSLVTCFFYSFQPFILSSLDRIKDKGTLFVVA